MFGQDFSHRRAQIGIASIEFALIAGVMLLIFLGIFVSWYALQAQQSVTRAAGDGARHVHELYFGSRFKDIDLRSEAKTVVEHSLTQSGLSLAHLKSQEQENLVTLTPPPIGDEITLTVSYPLQLFSTDDSNNFLSGFKKLQAQSVILLAHP